MTNTNLVSITAFGDYKDVLRSELAKRQLQFSNYSLRDYADELKISPSTLSEIFSGKHELSRRKAVEVGTNLGFREESLRYFCDLVDCASARSVTVRSAAQKRIEQKHGRLDAHFIGEERFHIIADWYHLAILELVNTANFDGSLAGIVARLGITAHQAEMAVARLKREELLTTENGRLKTCVRHTKTTDEIPAQAVKLFQKQMLAKAQQALVTQDVEQREVSSIILSINKKDLPEAKKMLKEFRRRFCATVEATADSRDEVYCLTTSFFSLETEKNSH